MASARQIVLCISFVFYACATSAFAASATENTSKLLLVKGYAKGIGGGPQANLDIVHVCNPEKIDQEILGPLMFAALSKIGAPPDPPTTDPLALAGGKEWKTSPAYVDPETMEKYKKASPVSLQPGHNYYVKFQGRLSIIKRALTLTTVVQLLQGVTAERSYPYEMNFDAKFFHDELEQSLAEEIQKHACS